MFVFCVWVEICAPRSWLRAPDWELKEERRVDVVDESEDRDSSVLCRAEIRESRE